MTRLVDRLLVITNSASTISGVLLESVLAAARERGDLQVVGVLDAAKQVVHRRLPKTLAAAAARALFGDPWDALGALRLSTKDIHTVAAKHGARVLVPPAPSINDPRSIELVRSLSPDLGLSVGCPQIMRRDLLAVSGRMVNYHNSVLPKYRGLGATGWSLYHGEHRTGFTFHVVNDKVDDGAILVQGEVPVVPAQSALRHEVRKTTAAAAAIPRLLDLMVRRDPGSPQIGEAQYFSQKDGDAITTIDDPRQLTAAEIQRRLWAFGQLSVRIGGEVLPVTALADDAPARPRSGAIVLEARDRRLVVRRLRHLPPRAYALLGARLGA